MSGIGVAGGGGVSGFKPGGPTGPAGPTGPQGPTGGAGEGAVAVQEGGVELLAAVAALNFDASDFTLADQGSDVAGITLAYGTGAGTPAEGNHTHAALYQPIDSTLTALAAYNTNGLIAQTAADTFAGRTITGTANEIDVSNGDGVAGNPTIALAAAPTFTDFTNAQHDHGDADDGGQITTAAISDFATAVDERARDAVGAALVAGNNIDITLNDGADTITIDVEALTAADISDFTEVAQDAVGAMVADTTTVNVTYTDATPELKWDVLDNTSIQKVTVRKNSGADVGSRKRLNLIEGANVTLTVTDDGAGDEVDITIAAGAGASISVEEANSAVLSASVLNFDGDDFTVTDAGSGQADITLGSAPSFADFTNAGHDHSDADDGGTLTLTAIPSITASAAELNILDGATLTVTELNFVDGVTSAIQTQIDGKQPLDADLTTLASAFTTASAAGAATLDFHEDTDNGTNRVRLAGPASTADVTVTLPSSAGTLELTSHNHDATYQPLDGDLTAIAALTTTAGGRGLLTLADPNADRLLLWDDSAGAFVQADVGTGLAFTATPTLDLDADLVTLASAFTTASGTGAASLKLAEDTDNGSNTVALTAPASIASDKTITFQDVTGTVYVSSGTDVALADGGTGASLADPNADRILFWDDSAAAMTWLTAGTGLAITDTTITVSQTDTFSVPLVIGDGTNEIADGVALDFQIPVAGTFIAWRLLATKFTSGSTGSIVLDIWADSYANFPPTDADSITAANQPTITTAAKAEDTSITDWTEAFSAGTIFRVNVDSCTTIAQCTLLLEYTRSV